MSKIDLKKIINHSFGFSIKYIKLISVTFDETLFPVRIEFQVCGYQYQIDYSYLGQIYFLTCRYGPFIKK